MGEEARTSEKLTGGNREGRSPEKAKSLGVAVLVGVGSEQVMFKQRCERSGGNDTFYLLILYQQKIRSQIWG